MPFLYYYYKYTVVYLLLLYVKEVFAVPLQFHIKLILNICIYEIMSLWPPVMSPLAESSYAGQTKWSIWCIDGSCKIVM